MPNEEDKTVVQTDGEAKASVDESKPEKSGGSKKLFLFGGIGVGAIVLGVSLALFVIKPMTSGSGGNEQAKTAQVESSKGHSKAKKGHEKSKKKDGSESEASTIYTIKDIIINPAGTGGTRFLSVSFAFELESEELKAEFETREPVIRDALITILSSKTVAQLTDPRQKEIARYQIKKRVSDLMRTNELAGVYYTDFVLQ